MSIIGRITKRLHAHEDTSVFTIRNRLIIGTVIAYGIAAAAQVISMPPVAIEMHTNIRIQQVEAYADTQTQERAGRTHLASVGSEEQVVRTYFADIPIMIQVARCESSFRQLDVRTGTTLRGYVNSKDLGVMQINEYYHGETAQRLGLNLHDIEDNMAYARYLYETQGTQPWSASRHCWGAGHLAIK